ncbi:MAG: HAMP domain-containing protein [Deltaproteobacteria bacterium]|nr:MAG: HAMP domain-containing protein [Deltaproteobacteria bacterium]
MKHFSFSNLRIRLVILILLAVVPAMAVMLYTASEQRAQDAAAIQENVQRLATVEAREESQLLEGNRQILKALAEFLVMHDGDLAGCNAFFADLLKHYHRYANFGAARPNGDVFCSALPSNSPINVSDREWFQEATETHDFAFSDYRVESITGKPVLVLAYPVKITTGEIKAVVFAALELRWLSQLAFYEDANLPPGTTLTKIDQKGMVLAHQPGPEKWIGKSLPMTDLSERVRKGGTGLVEGADPEGIPYYYAFTPLMSGWHGRGVYLILGIPEKVAFAHSDRMLFRNVACFAIVGVLALLATWFGANALVLRPVNAMINAARQLAAGDLSARTELANSQDELGQLTRAFDQMAEKLEQRQAESARAEEDIKSSREQLRYLSAHLQSVREKERALLAREIHDEFGQALTALKMDLSWLDKRLPMEQAAILGKIKSMSKLIDATIHTVQRLSADLRPGILDDLGLAAAIEWQAEEFQNRTGIQCEVALSPHESLLSRDLTTVIFRVFQETLTNIIRHAKATKVEISLKGTSEKIVLAVKDNGRGITEQEINGPRSFGLIGMRERVALVGGEVYINGVPDKGTQITVSIPLDKQRKEIQNDQHTHRR